MTEVNSKKLVKKAMNDVRKAILEENKNTKRKILRKKKIKKDDVLLLTEVYIDPDTIKKNNKKAIQFKRNVKKLVEPDIQEWIESSFSNIVKNYIKRTVK